MHRLLLLLNALSTLSLALPCALRSDSKESCLAAGDGGGGTVCKYDLTSSTCLSATVAPLKKSCSRLSTANACSSYKQCYYETATKTCKQRPNVIVSVADDLGYFDVNFERGDFPLPHVNTPALAALRRNGIYLSRHYTASSCAPSRAALVTGRPQFTLGFETSLNLTPGRGIRCGVPPKAAFLSEVLRDGGNYTNHAFGKWHLGQHRDSYVPTGRGFLSYVGILAGQSDHPTGAGLSCICSGRAACSLSDSNVRRHLNVCQTKNDVVNMTLGVPHRGASSWRQSFDHLDKLTLNEVTKRIESIARDAMFNSQNNGYLPQPFFFYIGWVSPHEQNHAPSEYLATVSPFDSPLDSPVVKACKSGAINGRKHYLGEVSLLDDAHAKMIQSLEENGLADSTLLIFLSDNGGDTYYNTKDPKRDCASGLWGFNYPSRGQKYSWFEGGIRTHAIIAALGSNLPLIPVARRGTEYDGLFHISDWFHTVVDFAGLASYASNNVFVEQDMLGISHRGVLTATRAPSPSDNPRVEMAAQIWNGAWGGPRYVVMRHDVETGEIYKLIVGYASKGAGTGGGDNPPISPKIYPALSSVKQPIDLSKSQFAKNVSYPDAPPLSNNENAFECTKTPCLFELTSDPGETTNLFKSRGSRVSELKALYASLSAEVKASYLGQFMCEPGYKPKDTQYVTDISSMSYAKRCGAWLPWLAAPNAPKIACASAS